MGIIDCIVKISEMREIEREGRGESKERERIRIRIRIVYCPNI